MTKILWLSHLLPFPPKGGALQRSFHLIRGATQFGDVDLVSFRQAALHPDAQATEDAKTALSADVNVRAIFDLPADRSSLSKAWLLLTSSVTREPYTIRWNSDERLRQFLESNSEVYDLVHFDTIGMFQYRSLFPTAAWVLNHHNVESEMVARRADRSRIALRAYLKWEAHRLQRWENSYGPEADAHLVVSELDRDRLLSIMPTSDVLVVENPTDCEYFKYSGCSKEEGSIIFVGRIDAYANSKAVRWIREEIWPMIRDATKGCKLSIVGRGPHRDILDWGDREAAVEVTGFVDDVRPWMNRAQVYLCPIRDGGGTRLKILDAMAMELPLVCHPMALEGIDAQHEEHVLLAESAKEFADACLRLLSDSDLRNQLGRRARKLVEERYALPTVWSHQAEAYMRALSTCARKRHTQ